MKSKIIICISILGFLAAIILTNINEIQNKEYVDAGAQQVKDQLPEDEAINPFKYVPVDWWAPKFEYFKTTSIFSLTCL